MKRLQKIDNQLLSSLKVLSSILKDEGSPLETHVQFRNNLAIVQNGIIGIGEPVIEDIACAPNGLLLKNALAKCGQSFSITQLEQTLKIQSGKFRATIPCMPLENLQPSFPDEKRFTCHDKFKEALEAIAKLEFDDSHVVTAAFLVEKGTVVATDRKLIIQFWHGVDLPPGLTLPKTLIGPMIKNNKKLEGFGFSPSSCTFFFEGGSWLKSQRFATPFPDVSLILDKRTNAHNLPDDFYPAIDALEPFSETGFVYCDSNIMRSHEEDGIGASYEVYGLPKGPVLNIKQMKMIKPFIKTVDFLVPHNGSQSMYWFGDNCRGAVAGRK